MQLSTYVPNLKSLRAACSRYEDMNGGAKCKIGVVWVVRGTQGHGQCEHSIERVRVPILL